MHFFASSFRDARRTLADDARDDARDDDDDDAIARDVPARGVENDDDDARARDECATTARTHPLSLIHI